MSGEAVRGRVQGDELPIDFGATNAGVLFLGAVDGAVPEADRPFTVRAVEDSLRRACAVPIEPAMIVRLREQAKEITEQFDRIDAAQDHLKAAARALEIDDELLILNLFLEGLDAVTKDGVLVRSTTSRGHEIDAADAERSRPLDWDEPAGSDWLSPYMDAVVVARDDRPTGGGTFRPSPAGIVTRMMWGALGMHLREPTETWSPATGIASLLDTYTPHRVTPKRVRKVIDAMGLCDRKGSLSGDYRMYLYPVR